MFQRLAGFMMVTTKIGYKFLRSILLAAGTKLCALQTTTAIRREATIGYRLEGILPLAPCHSTKSFRFLID